MLLSNSDTQKKYSSHAAELYKGELLRQVKEDVTKFPMRIMVDGVDTSPVSAEAAQGEEDLFFSWEKPAAPKTISSSALISPPIIGPALQTKFCEES
ncbi:hypothetical protein F4604DRAFT_1926646 [Suillus subluteus]|nr:hypothetical protein F4604DRAFT_1926646 [Suillus subluteus]